MEKLRINIAVQQIYKTRSVLFEQDTHRRRFSVGCHLWSGQQQQHCLTTAGLSYFRRVGREKPRVRAVNLGRVSGPGETRCTCLSFAALVHLARCLVLTSDFTPFRCPLNLVHTFLRRLANLTT